MLNKIYQKSQCLLLTTLLFPTLMNCQYNQIAYAEPISGINIDGDLDDWPVDIEFYSITQPGFGEVKDDEDMSASFRVGYNVSEGALYLALEVIDDIHIADNEDHDINAVDRVLLYIDAIHSLHGNSSTILEYSEKHHGIHDKPKAWDPLQIKINEEQVDQVTRRSNNLTTYEWKISLGSKIKNNTIIHLDWIIADIDEDEEETWISWKEQLGKSNNSSKLGDVLLVPSKEKVSQVNGNLYASDTLIKDINSVVIVSTLDPFFNLECNVDSTGHYSVLLPQGTYSISPRKTFSTDVGSAGFKQNTRAIIQEKPIEISVTEKETMTAPTINLFIEKLPLDMFESTGILFQSDNISERVDRFVELYQDYFDIPAVSIALIKDGKKIHSKSYGIKDNLTNIPVTKSTLFEAASITKAIFSIMVLRQAEKGTIDLDLPLFNYLRFPNLEDDPNYKLITARHVLNHETGMDNWSVGSYAGGFSPDIKVELRFKPGTDVQYSGEAMNYLGRVLSKLTDRPLHQLFEEEIASNFNLKNTYFHYSDQLANNLALGHMHHHPYFKSKFDGIDSPASSLVTEADDFSNFMIGLLNKEYLSEASYASISQPSRYEDPEKSLYDAHLKQGIANGFFVTESLQGKMIMHGGNNGDYDCKFVILPEHQMGFAVFTNSNLGDEFNRLLELYLLRGESALALE